jgi:hypothetical protein
LYTAALLTNTDEVLQEFISNQSEDIQIILEVIGFLAQDDQIEKALEFAFNVV